MKKFIYRKLFGIILFLFILSSVISAGEVMAGPRVKVYVGIQPVVYVVKARHHYRYVWIKGHYKRVRSGHLVLIPGHRVRMRIR
jgi:hypothetical protein